LGKTKNDGRPPDTGKALMQIRKVKEPEYEKFYRWKQNSCWLESSLAVLFAAASRDYSDSLEPMFSGLPPNHPLKDLRQMFHTRRETVQISGYESGGCDLLTTQRDGPGENAATAAALRGIDAALTRWWLCYCRGSDQVPRSL
jgi:hypothetical protein